MSHNQSRAERSESTQYRKTGRSGSFNQQRQFSAGVSTKGGGCASSGPTNPSSRSFKKYNSNAPVGQPSAGNWNVDSSDSYAVRAVQNVGYQHQPTHRVSDTLVTSTSSNLKSSSTDASSQKTAQAVPKSPASNVSSTAAPSNVSNATSEPKAPTTPGKGDTSKSFPLQFGSISPGFMNGMQVPAQTSSAPPNLDEQKRDQARNESLRTAPALPISSVPRHLPKKDAGVLDQPNASEAHLVFKSKRDVQVSGAPPGPQAQKHSLHHIPGMPMQLPFHQPQIPVQFGGPNPQIQSQAMAGVSLPMPIPMSLPLGNPPVQHSIFVPGLQPHPMQSQGMMHQGPQRNNADSDRWQRGTGFQKGLMPSPQTPMQVMHKAERKYEVGKITDEEQAKPRQLKAILNKLTPQNFEKLSEQVKQVNIDNVTTLSWVTSQIFDKALMEPTLCEMYANFCYHLAADLPDLSVDNQKVTFKRLLLNKCQEEFEREEREEEEANKAEEEGEVKQSAEEREEKRLRARRRMLGSVGLLGELYKKRMVTERIMRECINKLLGQPYQNPDQENIEALCKLMSTIGKMIDHPKAKEHMDAYYDYMAKLSNNMKISSKVRFMLKDAIDLRKNKWQERRKVEGPKKIDRVHRDAAQEHQAQARLARVPSMGNPVRRGPMDFGPRSPSMFPSPNSQISGYRGAPPQLRGYGSQDARMEERPSENRTMSVPLPQRPLGEDSITLGPQGGLARGMAFRGQTSAPNVSLVEMPSPGDGRMPERTPYIQREDLMPRYMVERFSAVPQNHSHGQDRDITYGNREVRNTDCSSDRHLNNSAPPRGGPPSSTLDMSSDKVWPDEHLRRNSLAAIREFYSGRDEKEIALCIKDLNAPSFYPSMISIWVTDSFERKDMERDLLTRLLINLAKSQDQIISNDQLIKGFESVLAVLEDAISDAPRAAELLGHMFAQVILENVVSLSDIGQLIHEGGEEQGRLVEAGLAAKVLGSILEVIKSEKGESVLNEVRSNTNLRLEDFRPPGSNKSFSIDKFI